MRVKCFGRAPVASRQLPPRDHTGAEWRIELAFSSRLGDLRGVIGVGVRLGREPAQITLLFQVSRSYLDSGVWPIMPIRSQSGECMLSLIVGRGLGTCSISHYGYGNESRHYYHKKSNIRRTEVVGKK